jgi:type IV pilus assembly protein PilB
MGQEILQLFRQSTEKAMQARPRIGTMLLIKKWITLEQLREALEAQRQHGNKLGHWLVKLGYITEEKLIMVLSEQRRLPWMSDIKHPFSEDALSALPKMLCKRFNVFPLEFAKNNQLVLAVDYGFTDEMIEAVDEVVGCKVKPFMTKTDVLKGLIKEHVEPQAENTTDVIAEKMNFANQVGHKFVKKWFDFEAERARFGLFEDTLWVRYLKGENVSDYFMLFDEASAGATLATSIPAAESGIR